MAKAKKSVVRAKDTPVTAVAKTAEQVQGVRNQIANVIMEESLEMAKRSARSVRESGNISTLKFLWEVAGLFPAPPAADDNEEDSLARTLLQRMGLSTDMPGHGEDDDGDVESE